MPEKPAHFACFVDIFIDIFPLSNDGDKKPMEPLPYPPTNKIQTQISFSVYKHCGMSKFTSLGYQSQERLDTGDSVSFRGSGIEQVNAGCQSGTCHWGASRSYRIEAW